jgi:3',5'-cyclic AMP phosphodiesterase CpdA
MTEERDSYVIAQFSDIHCGDSRFDRDLMLGTISEINQLGPDLTIIPGDLTADGYFEQFYEARDFIEQVECAHIVVVAGNHDCRNVGYLYFESIFGSRRGQTVELDFNLRRDESLGGGVQKKLKLLALDSNKPDLNDGEIGRDHYTWIDEQFPKEDDFKLFILHHHLVSIPGTGRERNVVWDSGDVLERLRAVEVDLVLCGHRHVPYTWPLAGMLVISSGTASTWRTRGYTQPSYNIIEIGPSEVTVTTKIPGGAIDRKESFRRRGNSVAK